MDKKIDLLYLVSLMVFAGLLVVMNIMLRLSPSYYVDAYNTYHHRYAYSSHWAR